jgi:hypothetical protein
MLETRRNALEALKRPVDEALIELREQLVRETEMELKLERLRAQHSRQAARALNSKLRELEDASGDSSGVHRGSLPRV